jgi:ATP-dependent RNA helicase DeaD
MRNFQFEKPLMTFSSYLLDPLVLDALRQLGYDNPTPIQESVIPLILKKEDVLALAETGSGKTAACAIPLCHHIDVSSNSIQGLIVVPTRELALQYAEEAQRIGKVKQVRVFGLFGGENMELQRAKLKHGVHVLVATPGRLIDFIYSRAIDLSHVKTLTLDEADEMLGLGFLEDLEFIMGCLVQEHQTLLFSATMPDLIRKIAKKHMKTPHEISLISTQTTPEKLEHKFYYCSQNDKKDALLGTLKNLPFNQLLLFVNSRDDCEKVYRELKRHFPSVDFLHGGMSQDTRSNVTSKFSKGKLAMLVATDVASRGLDFTGVTHVVNLTMPHDDEVYLHRAGRTARRGKEGVCITFVTGRDLPRVKRLFTALQKNASWLNQPPAGR